MNKYFAIGCVTLMAGISPMLAQDGFETFKKIDEMSQSEADKKAAAAESLKNGAAPQKEPTVITATKEASFDSKTKVAIFVGEVRIKDTQFSLAADKLTVFFKKGEEPKKPGDPAKPVAAKSPDDSKPAPEKTGAAPASSENGSGLERAIAEGNVIVESDRPDSNGGAPVHYIGKGAKVEYNATNGEAILRGWPIVQQGINTIVATEESTVIYLYRDGKMKIDGQHKVNITDPGPGNPMSPKPQGAAK